MVDEKIKRRMRDTIKAAKEELGRPKELYRVININDPECPFHLERFRKSEEKGSEVLKIRIVLDRVSDEDIYLCKEYKMPGKIFTKLIMCKKLGQREFETIEV